MLVGVSLFSFLCLNLKMSFVYILWLLNETLLEFNFYELVAVLLNGCTLPPFLSEMLGNANPTLVLQIIMCSWFKFCVTISSSQRYSC